MCCSALQEKPTPRCDAPARRIRLVRCCENREWGNQSGNENASRATALRHACMSRDVSRSTPVVSAISWIL